MSIINRPSNSTALSPNSKLPPKSFSSLPLELRRQIYTLLLPPKQGLRVGIYQTPNPRTCKDTITFAISPTPTTPSTLCLPSPSPSHPSRASPLLALSQESRSFFLTHFPLSLPCGQHGTSRIYFHPSEIIFIDKLLSCPKSTEPFFQTLERERGMLSGVKRMAVDRIVFGSEFEGTTGVGRGFGWFLGLFGGLEGLGVVFTNWGVMGTWERKESRKWCEKEFGKIREGMGRCGGRVRVPEMRVIEGWP